MLGDVALLMCAGNIYLSWTAL